MNMSCTNDLMVPFLFIQFCIAKMTYECIIYVCICCEVKISTVFYPKYELY